jgi:hypothetical protein
MQQPTHTPANLSQFVVLALTKVPEQEKKLTARWEEEGRAVKPRRKM